MTNLKPKIRFKEFEGSTWHLLKFGDILERYVNQVKVEANKEYFQIGIRSHGKGLFYKEPVTGATLGNKRVFWITEGALIINIVFAWEQAVSKTTIHETGMVASHRFPMYLPKNNQSNIDFILNFLLTKKGKFLLESASPGGAGRNKTLGQKEFDNSKLYLPNLHEQTKIAAFLSAVGDKLNLLKEKKGALEAFKKGMMQKIFSQEIRFKDVHGNDFEVWEVKCLGDCLDYEQPTPYLVHSTEYDDSFQTPVLTAGKKFILGYTNEEFGIYKNPPVIIFDDFTTATQYVDFPFKAKSSAMKILKTKGDDNIKFLYEAIQMINFEIGGHGRHWISVFSVMEIPIPCLEEQIKIASFLSAIDEKIVLISKQIDETQEYKKGLLQQMFC